MNDPRQITHWHQKFTSRARGEKFYRTGFQMAHGVARFSRAKFRTATQAEDYGARILLRWMRLHDAAVGMSQIEPAQ